MSDIKNYKALDANKLLEWLKVEIDLSDGNTETHKADRWAFGHVRSAIRRGEFDIPSTDAESNVSLITTIESQKEEITKWKTSKESWEKETLFANGEIRKRDNEIVLLTKRMKDYEKQALENMVRFEDSQDVVEHLNIQIESLKAITELAVKGLKWYSDPNNEEPGECGTYAKNTLSEIARLQNE